MNVQIGVGKASKHEAFVKLDVKSAYLFISRGVHQKWSTLSRIVYLIGSASYGVIKGFNDGQKNLSGGSDRVLVLGGSFLCKAKISLCITDARSSMNDILYIERLV